MRIAVTGGKGGTGKSLVATSLAAELSKNNKVLLVDADVECPNDHLVLSIKRRELRKVVQFKPEFNYDKCVKCGACSRACKEKAILFVKHDFPKFVPEQCIGCGACLAACPSRAITKGKNKIGMIYSGEKSNLSFLSGETIEGVEETSPVVNTLKKEIKDGFDYEIIDTAAGAHCSVISALIGSDLALVVTEPTPFGSHDAALMLELLGKLGIPSVIVLNKSTIGEKGLIKGLGSEVIAEIPYDKKILEAYAAGRVVKHKAFDKIIKYLEDL
ncbi:4Fe-4S dicluster domain-containing protein [archaeon]|nr:4Fe-4S dicluster domain-containing protein [archaeon]